MKKKEPMASKEKRYKKKTPDDATVFSLAFHRHSSHEVTSPIRSTSPKLKIPIKK